MHSGFRYYHIMNLFIVNYNRILIRQHSYTPWTLDKFGIPSQGNISVPPFTCVFSEVYSILRDSDWVKPPWKTPTT